MKNILKNKIEQIKKSTNLLQNILAQLKKKEIIWKRNEENSKNAESFTKWIKPNRRKSDQSRDELEQIAKIRRIKNYEEMSKEELIISLLKSKQSIAKLFNNNLDYDKISDIKRILNRLRDILPKKYRKEIK